MAQERGALLLYDWMDDFELLKDEEVGVLIRALLSFGRDGEWTVFEDRTMQVLYNRYTDCIWDNKIKYEEMCKQNAKNGKKGGRPRVPKPKQSDGFSGKAEKAKEKERTNYKNNIRNNNNDNKNNEPIFIRDMIQEVFPD